MLNLLLNLFLFIVFVYILSFLFEYISYKRSLYHQEVNLPFLKVRSDKGYYGEYLTFKALERVRGYSRILGNVYIPKDETTTEIDVIFIHETGIYVVESKNYSGWIFGNEEDRYWTQTFENGMKFRFYNPIWQNNTHIRYLSELLSDIDDQAFKSIIAFSERCTLKKITKTSNDIPVINRNRLNKTMRKTIKVGEVHFDQAEIDQLYTELKEYANVSEEFKEQHIAEIKARMSSD